MASSIERGIVLQMLDELRDHDPHYRVFGAEAHRYRLNPPLPHADMAAFESRHSVTLPADYRYFITEIGNGGAGPYYGLFPFGEQDDGYGFCKWEFGGLVGDLSAEFPHESAWNLPESFWARMPDPGPDISEEDEDRMMEAWDRELEKHYWNPKIMNGAIPICHEGCAYRQWLVINGRQKGSMWADSRASDGGIAPVRDEAGSPMTFSDWYMAWLRNPLIV